MRFGDHGFEEVLAQFREMAADYRDAAMAGRHHGFSNVRETLGEIHKGASKAWPCGAGFGLLGVSTAGDVNLCHRFAGSDDHKLGTVRDGIDRDAQRAFLESHHVANKTDCATCWARPLCAGGCYHEAHTRYGTTERPNLHYCDWIRGWTDTCLTDLRRDRAGQPGRSCASSMETTMKHLSPLNAKARRLEQALDVAGLTRSVESALMETLTSCALEQLPQQPAGPHIPRAAPRCSRRAGKWTAPAARRGSASRSSAICSIAIWAVSGPRRCPTS